MGTWICAALPTSDSNYLQRWQNKCLNLWRRIQKKHGIDSKDRKHSRYHQQNGKLTITKLRTTTVSHTANDAGDPAPGVDHGGSQLAVSLEGDFESLWVLRCFCSSRFVAQNHVVAEHLNLRFLEKKNIVVSYPLKCIKLPKINGRSSILRDEPRSIKASFSHGFNIWHRHGKTTMSIHFGW